LKKGVPLRKFRILIFAMHKHISKLLLLTLPFFAIWSACSNDFDVTTDWTEIPVVYAILSPTDTAHYIRVEKAFLDPVKGAPEIAKIADSLYYPENAIRVFLVRELNGDRMQLTRVDGAREGIVRKTGVFAASPNWLYKLPTINNGKINGGERYRLEIERTDGKPKVTAHTKLPADIIFNSPNPAQFPRIISFKDTSGIDLQWRTDTFGLFNNVSMRIKYQEQDANGGVVARRSFIWKAAEKIKRTNIAGPSFLNRTTLLQSRFFKVLQDSIPAIAPGRFRYFEQGELIIETGGYEIGQLLDVQAVATGLTGAEIIPTYSNISEGYGIFSSKSTSILTNVKFSPETVETMNKIPQLRVLGFSN
jgi:hypothetical protein